MINELYKYEKKARYTFFFFVGKKKEMFCSQLICFNVHQT